jgi:hypothetical protein
MWEKLAKWLIFSVLLSLVPLLANYGLYRITENAIDLELLLSHGELFLIAAALTGTALGEIIASRKKRQHGNWRLCSAGGSLLIVILASMLFAFVSGTQLANRSLDTCFVEAASLVVYVCACVTGTFSIVLSEI